MASPRRHFDIDQLALLDPENGVSAAPAPAPEAIRHFFALLRLKGVGRHSLAALYDRFSPLGSVWTAPQTEVEAVLRAAGNRHAKALAETITTDNAEAIDGGEIFYDAVSRRGVTVLFKGDPAYPASLRDADGPRWLFVHGSTEVLTRRANVAIVGTREPTARGLELAREAARELATAGFVITSGLATGIDSEAHATTLDLGGAAVAVLGNGLNVEFPAGSRNLRQRIVQNGGAIVTEYLWNDSYNRASFVERNRIQAALAGAVLPIEARRKSGTAHTIRFALELKRLLFGVTLDRSTPAEGEVYAVLRENNAPVFDLSAPEGSQGLRDFLRPIASDLAPPSTDNEWVWRRAYRETLRELQTIGRRRHVTDAEREWLLQAVSKLLSEPRDQ
jgi:DNA protecting protein DprA